MSIFFTISIFFSIIIIFFNYIFRTEIANYLGIIDTPDKKRKKHLKPTPLVGSLPLFISLIFYTFFFFLKNNDLASISILSMFFFIIGFFDDKYNISYNQKFFFFFIILFIFLNLNSNFLINSIYFENFNIRIGLEKKHSLILTLICILLLVNAFNFSDGINGLSSCIAVIWLGGLIFFTNIYDQFLIYLIICICINAMPIFKGKYFIGNSGTLFLSIIISLKTINTFNNNTSISYEQIFLLFLIPGLDMLRLVLLRLLDNKNPFLPDNNHLHHYLINNFSLIKTLIIYNFIMIFPLVLTKILPTQNCIFIGILFYFFLIFKLKKN